MRITLIKAGTLDPVHPMVVQPLGILYLAAAARDAGHQVALIDAKAEGLDLETILKRTEFSAPEVVGISGFANEWESFEQMGTAIKQRMPNVHLIGGGPYATSFPEEVLERAPFDYLVVGEGEITFLELLRAQLYYRKLKLSITVLPFLEWAF